MLINYVGEKNCFDINFVSCRYTGKDQADIAKYAGQHGIFAASKLF